MFKFFSACRKESLILVRDPAGLVLLFVMPMIMVVSWLGAEKGWEFHYEGSFHTCPVG